MKYALLVFTITGDDDYGTLAFQDSGITIEQINDFMDENGVTSVRSEDWDEDLEEGEWEVNFVGEHEFADKKDAEAAVRLISKVEDHIGDYDAMKSNGYETLIIPIK